MSEAVTVTRLGAVIPGQFDEQGNPKRSATETIARTARAFAPSNSVETAREWGIDALSQGAIFDNRGVVYLATDILTIRGEQWQVQGEPADWAPLKPPGPEGIVIGVKRV